MTPEELTDVDHSFWTNVQGESNHGMLYYSDQDGVWVRSYCPHGSIVVFDTHRGGNIPFIVGPDGLAVRADRLRRERFHCTCSIVANISSRLEEGQ